MTSFADDFRNEAIAKEGEVVNRKIRGWSFSLSYGAVDPKKVAVELEGSTLRWMNKGKDVTHAVLERLKTVSPEELQAAKEAQRGEWLLSAKLFPPGRSSVDADWIFLGQMIEALRAPENALQTPFETTHPNDTHYWRWKDD